MKENVIIGKLIPAGTGMKRYKNIELDYGINAEIMENFERQQREAEEAAREAEAAAAAQTLDMNEDIDEIFEEPIIETPTMTGGPDIVEMD